MHSLIYCVFWLTNSEFYGSVNRFIQKALGFQVDVVLLTMLLFGAVGLWSIVRILGAWIRKQWMTSLGRVFVAAGSVFLVAFYAIFIMLFSREPIQLTRLEQWLLYHLPFLVGAFLIVLIGITLPWVRTAMRNRRENTPYAAIFIPIWIFVWCFPIWNLPDCVYRGDLPDKPALLAHRGASWLAPENTLSAMQLVVEMTKQSTAIRHTSPGHARLYSPILGMESDVRVSSDGVPFLMHDPTLQRTTNIVQVFPERQEENAESFSLGELQSLNAGVWFIEKYAPERLPSEWVSTSAYQAYAEESIPTLAQWLELTKNSPLVILFDIYLPEGSADLKAHMTDIVFQLIKAYDMDRQVWMLADEDTIRALRPGAPKMQWVAGLDYTQPASAARLRSLGYTIVNSQYGLSKQAIKEYQSAGLSVNLWVVDEPWQYSRLWVSGVDSVTTNNLHVLLALESPRLAFSYTTYILLWCSFGALLVGFVTWRILRNKRNERS